MASAKFTMPLNFVATLNIARQVLSTPGDIINLQTAFRLSQHLSKFTKMNSLEIFLTQPHF